jgi:hypothetical protein
MGSRVNGDNKGRKVGKDCKKKKDVMGSGAKTVAY